MKTICLIVPNMLPVPAVKGGAIEELVTIIIEENEKNPLAEFLVCSPYDERAKQQSMHFQYTRFIYIKEPGKLMEMGYYLRKIIRKVFRLDFVIGDSYYGQIFNKLDFQTIDYIVAEGGNYREFKGFLKRFHKSRMYLHLHHHYKSSNRIEDVFGNVISVSRFVQKEWEQSSSQTDQNQYIVHNCVNEDKFNQSIGKEQRTFVRKQLGCTSEDFIVIYCGRILELKGVRELIQAVISLNQKDIKLIIVGDMETRLHEKDDYINSIQTLIQRNTDKIKLTGYITNSKLYQYYQCANLQVVPSLCEEAAGLVTIEGMLSGLPLIVTNSGGMPEYVKEAAIIIDKNDDLIEQLKRNILNIKNNEDLRNQMSHKSKKQSADYRKANYLVKFIECFKIE